ncbi:GntR family transcriptional regulator [Vallitalea pronyensis]|uniref:GntR family transcriptional regulator n=1 Tax=Vallitalea pronyensis TaxID=1348613 RepID=A0A8J8MLW0_9FIRM|nr:GntR family transcriptional regulator [Vallitalea pronyensis]QUI24075.1 GntR family transcriptional regulator [Vallitalea pronyensis]
MQYNPSIPVYIQIKDDIIHKIREGVWKENEKIPSEVKFMEEYGAGRGTIREAIRLIIDEGYLYIKKGIGTFVAQKEVGISIEPFVSLTYFIKMRGLDIHTKVLAVEEKIMDQATSKETGIQAGTPCLFVKRIRMMKNQPIGLEIFHFVYEAHTRYQDFDFTQGISHYLFHDCQLTVSKMNMDMELVEASGEGKQLLELGDSSMMLVSNRIVYINANQDILYHLTFVCGEELSQIGLDKFV